MIARSGLGTILQDTAEYQIHMCLCRARVSTDGEYLKDVAIDRGLDNYLAM